MFARLARLGNAMPKHGFGFVSAVLELLMKPVQVFFQTGFKLLQPLADASVLSASRL